MKNSFIALAMALLSCAPLVAQDTPAAPVMATALADSGITYLTGTRPAADAAFYVYLSSASWCPPCRAIMPKVVAQYPEIKAAGGEVILLCFDGTPQAGQAYLKKYNAAFPAIMCNAQTVRTMEAKLPGFKAPHGIPNVIFVTPDGKAIHNGHGSTVIDWRNITSSAK